MAANEYCIDALLFDENFHIHYIGEWKKNVQILFVWFDSLRPINNISVKQGRFFLGWTSTKLG